MRLKRSECSQCLNPIQNELEQGELFRVDTLEDSWHVAPLGDICQRPSPFIQVLAFIEARYALEADLAADECVNSVWLVPDDKDPKEFIRDKLLEWHGYYPEDDDIEIEPMDVEELVHEHNVLNSTHRTIRFELKNVLHMIDGGLTFA